MSWEDLNYKQRAELAKIYIKNGITSLDDMKDHYNASLGHQFKLGGEENQYNLDTTENNPVNFVTKSNGPIIRPIMRALGGSVDFDPVPPEIRRKLSEPVMRFLRSMTGFGGNQTDEEFRETLAFGRPVQSAKAWSQGPLQNAFLMHPEDARRYILNSGAYIEGIPGDYGLVKAAVGNRHLPVYQRKEDAESRSNLVPIANLRNDWFGDADSELIHAGNYPTTIYVSAKDGKTFYQKAWDLNDYSNPLLNKLGFPAVQTTGFQKVVDGSDYVQEKFYDDYLSNHGLYYDKDIDAVALKPVEITGRRLKAKGGHLFLGGGEKKPFFYNLLNRDSQDAYDNGYLLWGTRDDVQPFIPQGYSLRNTTMLRNDDGKLEANLLK